MPLPRGQADFAETAPVVQLQQLQEGSNRWRHIFTAVMVVMVVLIWAAFVEHTTHEHTVALETVAQRDANLATAVDHYAVRVFRNARAVHQLLADVYRNEGEPRLVELLRDRLRANDAFVELAVCTADGRILSSIDAATFLTAADCARLQQSVRPSTEITVGTPLATGGALLVPLSMPISQPQPRELPDVAVALTPVPTLLGVMASFRLRDATTVLLVGDDGGVRAAWRSGSGPVSQQEAAQALAFLRTGGDRLAIDGREQLVSVRPLPTWKLQVVVASSRSDALAAFHQRRVFYLAACAIMSVVLLGVYLVLASLQAESTRRAQSLSRARARLQVLNQQLDAQVQQRTQQLEQAYRDLESFSYTIAHDVRAPLAAISAFAGELEPTVAASGNEKHVRYLARIRANARQMDALTQHLLELGKLTRAPLRLVRVDLSALAHELLGRLRDTEPGRAVECHVQDGLAARADAALVRQVLDNLLGNAWKFTAGRTPARITFGRLEDAQAEGWQTFFVSDNGAGFDSNEADNLFQPFQRLHAASEFPGTGVGLATVQRILALHGGKVWCQARPDEGATFFFTLREAAGG
ncbi:MAG: sensor histidine kinase [Ramlibacter sp.]